MENKEGTCCTICGVMMPDAVKIRRISVDGNEVGIDRLDQGLYEVICMGIPFVERVKEGFLSRARVSSSVPSSRADSCGAALAGEFRAKLKMKG